MTAIIHITTCLMLAVKITITVTASYQVDGKTCYSCASATVSVPNGDVNGDGKLSILDVLLTLNWVLQGYYPQPQALDADANRNGKPDIADPLILLRTLLGLDPNPKINGNLNRKPTNVVTTLDAKTNIVSVFTTGGSS